MKMTFKKSHLLGLMAGATLMALPATANAGGFYNNGSTEGAIIGAIAGGLLAVSYTHLTLPTILLV